MNRSFDERIARDLHEIADEASVSPSAWDDLAGRLDEPREEPETPMIALTSRSGDGRDEASGPDVPAHSATWTMLVAAAIGLALVGGIVMLPRSPDDGPVTPGAAPTTDEDPRTEPRVLPPPGGTVEPGTYRSTLLGVPITFTTNEPLVLGRERPGHFVLLNRNVQANVKNDRAIIVARIGGWNTREQATDADFRGTGSIDPYDVDTWAATNDVLVDDMAATTVGGRPATVLDVRVDPDSTIRHENCSFSSDGSRTRSGDRVDWNPCFWYMSLSAEFDPELGVRADLRYRMVGLSKSRFWVIEVPGEDPIVIEAVAPLDDTAFFDEVAATVVATFRFEATDPGGSDAASTTSPR